MATELNARSCTQQPKPHAVVSPFPAHGHINPMMQLSKTLASNGFVVTFVSTEYRCKQILEAQVQSRDLSSGEEEEEEEEDGLLDIRVEGLNDGLPACFDREYSSIELAKAINNLGGVFEELMLRLCRQEPPVTCLISDSFLPWTQEIANKWRIPRVFFWTQSVAVYTIFANTRRLISNGFNPFEENLNTATGMITDIPGIPPLPATYLPYRTRVVGDGDRRPLLSQSLEQQFGQLNETVWIIANSFNELESRALLALEVEAAPKIHLLGPLLPATCLDGTSTRNGMDCECLQWLDKQPVSSVLYISFGTVATLSTTQVAEVAMGLIAIQQPFLWVIRSENLSEMLPEGFVDSTKEQGMVIKWANQPLVLAHPAVGGFVTHCGWNSTLESISMGVPMLTWPHFLDQFTNSWFIVNEWKIGFELKRRTEDGMVGKGELERAARLLMQEQEGREVRSRAEKLRDAARKAAQMGGGSSDRNLQLFVQDMMSRATKACVAQSHTP